MIYCYPKLSKWDLLYFRLGGPGLGNLLFPWARAKIIALKNNYAFITPTWPQIKLGPFLRQELDKRTYFLLFNSAPTDVSGLHRISALIRNNKKNEYRYLVDKIDDGDVIVVSGMDGMFSDFLDYSDYLSIELSGILRRNNLLKLERDYFCNSSIAVHVRFSDFSIVTEKYLREGSANSRLPLEWYISAIGAVRKVLGGNVNVNIFSDAPDIEIAPLLALNSVSRVSKNNAIEDILLMSKHKVLIASGSTFSMWSSFLGQIPTIWFPGQFKSPLVKKIGYEIEYTVGDELPLFFTP